MWMAPTQLKSWETVMLKALGVVILAILEPSKLLLTLSTQDNTRVHHVKVVRGVPLLTKLFYAD